MRLGAGIYGHGGCFVATRGNAVDGEIAEHIEQHDAEPQDDQEFKVSE